jgi:hypothetical protein
MESRNSSRFSICTIHNKSQSFNEYQKGLQNFVRSCSVVFTEKRRGNFGRGTLLLFTHNVSRLSIFGKFWRLTSLLQSNTNDMSCLNSCRFSTFLNVVFCNQYFVHLKRYEKMSVNFLKCFPQENLHSALSKIFDWKPEKRLSFICRYCIRQIVIT